MGASVRVAVSRLATIAIVVVVGCATARAGGAPAAPEVAAPAGESTAQHSEPPLAEPQAKKNRARQPNTRRVLRGKATYYADSLAGNKTASGERYNPKALTAAHRKLPFGTRVRVVRVETGDSVVVTINDRGPFSSSDRIIDLSRAAAERLKMIRAGVVKVRVEVLP